MTRGGLLDQGRPARTRALRRWLAPPVRSRVFDWAIAILLALGAVAGVLSSHPRVGMVTGTWTSVLLLAVCLAMVWRRSRPAAVLALTAVTDIIVHAAYKPVTLESLQYLFALYACGKYLSARTAWLAAGPAIAIELAAAWFWPSKDIVVGLIIGALVVALGQYIRLRGELAGRRRAEAAAAAVRSERRRIARELHDVVAHHISVMSVLVGAARTTMSIDPDRAAEALATTDGKALPGAPESGYGLGGMAERAALCSGRLQAGARPEGGFAVRAWLPTPAALPETGFA